MNLQLKYKMRQSMILEDVIHTIESENNVTIAYTPINQSEDAMNDALRMQLTKSNVK